MSQTIENCRFDDGLVIKRLRHFKCSACGARFFDDDAMHCIHSHREKQSLSGVV